MRRQTVALTIGFLFLLVVGNAWGAIQYTVTDLGTLRSDGGGGSRAYGINASGQVVGAADTGNGNHAFLYGGGTMTDLGSVPGYPYSEADGINANGQVVGYSQAGASGFTPFLYAGGTMTNLGMFPGSSDTRATAINASSQVVGRAILSGTSRTRAFLWQHGVMTDLGILPNGLSSQASGINDSGQVVGMATTDYGAYPFLYSNGTMTALPSDNGWAFGINNSGQVVGRSGGHAFLYSNGVMTTLQAPASYSEARGINSSGQVVGFYSDFVNERAFVFSNGAVADLTSLVDPAQRVKLQRATAINDAGQIAAWGTDASGRARAFLLTPVPEPSTLALLVGGAVGLLAYGWRRWRR